MSTNSQIYLIGLAVLFFLIVTFFFIRKISNNGKLKVKIEKLPESPNSEVLADTKNQQSFNFDRDNDQELVILNLISMDRSMFDMDQIFGFLNNYGAKIIDSYFAFYEESQIEKFRVINALKPGTFEEDTKTFAIAIVCDLNTVKDPLNTVKQMIEFSLSFSENFYATLCDQERTPITKQMISHIESRAQDIARIKQLERHKTDKED
jgi:FtsZ-interacting cell division protein ZipA|tara:strand:+ start:1327 stop:1947 length:621 start_codon:yes stop_codon:yes gene_type:complete